MSTWNTTPWGEAEPVGAGPVGTVRKTATVYDALKIARSYLNDNLAHTWSDTVLFPFAVIAHQELQLHLRLHEIAVVQETSASILIEAGRTNVGADIPADLIVPSRLYEKNPGETNAFYVEMNRTTSVPERDPIDYLLDWTWQGEDILFVGATQDKEIFIKYQGKLTTPATVNDNLGFTSAELFIGPRTAACVLATIADPTSKARSQTINSIATDNLDLILRFNIKQDQDLPIRRRAYRRSGRRRVC